MASAFSTSNMKAEFHNIRTACSQLVEVRMCQLKRKPAAQCALPIRALYIQHSSMSRQPAAHGKLPGRMLGLQEEPTCVGWRAQVLKKGKPEDVVDIDNALCRESMDVIGAHAPARPGRPSQSAEPLILTCLPSVSSSAYFRVNFQGFGRIEYSILRRCFILPCFWGHATSLHSIKQLLGEAGSRARAAAYLLPRCSGRVGFGKDMGATRALTGDASGQAIDATSAGMLEADRRQTDPLRKYMVWRKVSGLPHMLNSLPAPCLPSTALTPLYDLLTSDLLNVRPCPCCWRPCCSPPRSCATSEQSACACCVLCCCRSMSSKAPRSCARGLHEVTLTP